MRAICLLLALYLSCLRMVEPLDLPGFSWTSTPGSVVGCQGDDINLDWTFVSHNSQVDFIIFARDPGGVTKVQYDYADGYVLYEDIEESKRKYLVTNYSQTSFKLKVRNVTKEDTAQYWIQLGGVGAKDETDLTVYRNEELNPTIYSGNNDVTDSEEGLGAGDGQSGTFALQTSYGLPANITIESLDDSDIHTCSHTSVCSYAVRPGLCPKHVTLVFTVDYGICEVYTKQLSIKVQGNKEKALMVSFLVIISLITILLVVLITMLIRRQDHTKTIKFWPLCRA